MFSDICLNYRFCNILVPNIVTLIVQIMVLGNIFIATCMVQLWNFLKTLATVLLGNTPLFRNAFVLFSRLIFIGPYLQFDLWDILWNLIDSLFWLNCWTLLHSIWNTTVIVTWGSNYGIKSFSFWANIGFCLWFSSDRKKSPFFFCFIFCTYTGMLVL